jgi:chromosomal replication initiation ATPase DnaA
MNYYERMICKDFNKPKYLTLAQIAKNVELQTGFSLKILKGRSRKRDIADVRHVFCAIARNNNHRLNRIGNYIDRDHSTVIYSVNEVQKVNELQKIYKQITNKTYENTK